MRIQPWMTVLASIAMLFAAQSNSWGQGYPPAGGGPYQPPYGNTNPGVLYPQGTPANMQPWPGISPYQSANIAETVHYNHKGSWFKEILYKEREYFASLEATFTKYRGPGRATIGSPHADVYLNTGLPRGEAIGQFYNATVTNSSIAGAVPGVSHFDTRVFPYPALDASANNYVEITQGAFPIWTTNAMNSPDYEAGAQARFGFIDEDGAGLMFSGWWGGESFIEFQRGQRSVNGVPLNQANITIGGGQLLNTRYGNIPLDNGEGFFPEFGTGSTAKYDVLYRLQQTTKAGGANISGYTRPIYKSDGIKVRPMYGIRYTYVNENFGFNGIDSGFNYDYNDATDDSTFAPDSALQLLYEQYEAVLVNEVKSHITGPEIGIRIDLGGDDSGLKVWSETVVGLAANYEEIELAGDKIGDPLFDTRINLLLVPRVLDPLNNTAFSDKASGTHLSPTFQQSIFADIGLFKYVPVLKNMDIFEEADLRIGYTVLVVGEVARPADAIAWKGFPLFSSIKENRQSWHAQQINLGINWKF